MENHKVAALEILKSKLQGAFINGFHVGDWWGLSLSVNNGTYWLVAQNITSNDEIWLNNWLSNKCSLYHTTVDNENIAKCGIVAANMRRLVTDVKLDDVYDLTIEFEHGGKIVIPATEEIVDWQWCLNETGQAPHMDYMVACFVKGEISINGRELTNSL
jgi:hypothetical protein